MNITEPEADATPTDYEAPYDVARAAFGLVRLSEWSPYVRRIMGDYHLAERDLRQAGHAIRAAADPRACL